MLKKSLIIFSATLVFFFNVATAKSQINSVIVKTPSIVSTNLASNNSRWGRPIITGLTQKNTAVLVYVDDKFVGEAKINLTKTITDNYYFQSIQVFNPGVHEVQVIARDKSNLNLSYISQKKTFTVDALPSCHLNATPKTTTEKKPIISGTTISGSKVSVYIDGVLNGTTNKLVSNSESVGFAYKPFLNLKPGKHTVYAISRTIDNKFQGTKSNEITLNIEAALPAPVLVKTVVNNKTTKASPFITGLAKNNLTVKFYINNKLDGEITVGSHKSGVSSFAYLPKQKLNKGNYKIYSITLDAKGKESIKSNVISYTYNQAQPTITKKAASERVVKKEIKKTTKKKIETKKETVKKTEKKKEEIKKEEARATSTEEKRENVGAINEKKEQQGEIKLSLIIFIAFLMIVIGWIIWVNRELVKKEEKGEVEEKKEKNNIK